MRGILVTALLTLLAAAGASGCGSDDGSGATPSAPELTVPRTAPPDTTEETAPRTNPAPGAGGGAPGGGAQAPQSPSPQQDTPQNDVKPQPGTPESRFEKYCDEHPGACG